MNEKQRACPKQMLNGPCGGVEDGKCEIGGECTWVKAFNTLKKTGKLKEYMKIKLPKR